MDILIFWIKAFQFKVWRLDFVLKKSKIFFSFSFNFDPWIILLENFEKSWVYTYRMYNSNPYKSPFFLREPRISWNDKTP